MPLVFLTLPVLAGAFLGWVSDTSFLSAFVLMAEPLFMAAGLYAVALLLLGRHLFPGACLLLGLMIGVLAVRLDPVPATPPHARAPWISRVQDCATDAKAATGPVRIASWRVSEVSRFDPTRLQRERPDLVVLFGPQGAALGRVLAPLFSGESKRLNDEVTVVVRGVFSYCSGRSGESSDEDVWQASLPAGGDRTASLSVLFPSIVNIGTFPLMVANLDQPGSVGDWRGWPHRLDAGAQLISAVARTVGANRMILVADLQSPSTFRGVQGHLLGAGLAPVEGAPSWPSRVAGVPMLPVHRLEQVWAGDRWESLASRSLEDQGQQHRPVVIDLAPAIHQAKLKPPHHPHPVGDHQE